MVDFQERDTHRGIDDGIRGENPENGSDASEVPEETDIETQDGESTELGVAILTVSATRSLESDPSGDAIAEAVEAAGHSVSTRELVRNDYDSIQKTVDVLTRREDVELVVSSGGTGIGPEALTVEATGPLFDKRLPGFGELFRRSLEAEIGSGAIATRAIAGIADDVPVFCLPEETEHVQLGVEELLLPEAESLVAGARSERDGSEE